MVFFVVWGLVGLSGPDFHWCLPKVLRALNLPVLGVNSLDAMVLTHAQSCSSHQHHYVVVLQAGLRQYFYAFYLAGKLEQVHHQGTIDSQEITEVVGNLVDTYGSDLVMLGHCGELEDFSQLLVEKQRCEPMAQAVLSLASPRFKAGERQAPHELVAQYVRDAVDHPLNSLKISRVGRLI